MSKRLLITTAQAKAKVHEPFLKSVENLEAKVIILPTIGQSAAEDIDGLDAFFQDYDIEYNKRRLNSNLAIDQFNVRPYQIDPVTGLQRFTQRETTKVFAGTKQRMHPIPHSNRKHPKFLITTGACTYPNYATGSDVSAERRRLGDIARRDHIIGGLLVEIVDDHYFYPRFVRANRLGEFTDLGIRYSTKGVLKGIKPEALVLGDYHVGRTSEAVRKTTYQMISDLNPKRIVLHDFFDGHSVSHHVEKQLITQNILQRLDFKHDNLETELRSCYDELTKLCRIHKGEVVVVLSNHHEFLNRYLDEGRFMKDPQNARMAFLLASYMAKKDYNDPVEAGIKMMGRLPNRIKFLRRDEDYKVLGFQLGAHGDKGVGFGYGNMQSKEADYGKSISGHVHKAQVLRETHTVGTMLPLNMYYMRGNPSAWTNSHAVLWSDGSVQHLMVLNGDYRLRK